MLLYPGVCKKVMQLYGTRSLDNGSYLRADYGVRARRATPRHACATPPGGA